MVAQWFTHYDTAKCETCSKLTIKSWLLNLNLTYETLWAWIESCRKLLAYFNIGKTQFVSFDLSNNFGAIDVKVKGSVLEEKSSFKEV